MKDGYIVIVLTTDNRIGYYDGTGFDTLKSRAKLYSAPRTAANDARKFNKLAGIKKAVSLPKSAKVYEIRQALTKRTIKKTVKRRAPAKKKSAYLIKPTNDKQFPYVITYNETVISAHKTKSDANKVKAIYLKGDDFYWLKNPIQGSRKRRETKAATLYEDFTGHKADSFEIVKLPNYDTGLKVGKVLGIMYQTTRDGNIENYVHEFKKTSQPDFAVSHDGQQIFLIGGSYLFKDSGINDT